MYLGHVDRISRQSVSGWAADSERPNGSVDVVVIVNGQKVARVACNRLRGDLRDKMGLGNGEHGFHYDFSPALPAPLEARILVRFADSGRPLSNGDAVLARDAAEPYFVAPQSPAPLLPAPTTPAGLFRLLGLLDPRQGLYPLLFRLDFASFRPDHAPYCAFGDSVAPEARGAAWTEDRARDELAGLLASEQFQKNVLAYALRAFPEKRRLLFVHIPKCAGSDLAQHLALRFPSLEEYLTDERRTRKDRLFDVLAEFVRELAFSDSIFAVWRGHVPLDYFIDADLIRPSDRVFTIVREPVEIAISAINYMITRFQHNISSGTVDPDTRDWLDALGMPSLPREITPQFVNEVSRRALHDATIAQPDSLCYWLGGGDAAAVVARLARYNVEVTTTAHYNGWLANEWGITSKTRENRSTQYLSLSGLSHQDLAYVQGLSPEDRKLYDLIEERLAASGRSSIFGGDLL